MKKKITSPLFLNEILYRFLFQVIKSEYFSYIFKSLLISELFLMF